MVPLVDTALPDSYPRLRRGRGAAAPAPPYNPAVPVDLREQERLARETPTDRALFALALDERPVAFSGPHGESLEWFGP